MNTYDSTDDTLKHKENIRHVIEDIIVPELLKRAKTQDDSKLQSPEKETYDEFIPKLKTAKYGSGEYLQLKTEMEKKGLKHHFEVNRHHPEHYPNNDISYMNLIDLVEMFADHYAASLRSDTGYEKGEKSNADRYHYSDQILKILLNTHKELFK